MIPVPWPNNTDVHQLTPSHVVVKRCSGGCHNSGTCVARVTRVRNVSVMMGKCPVGGGKCDKECASLQVEDEVECECGCSKHVQATCQEKPSTHMFNKDTCECQCKDQDARKKCFETPGKVWDSSSCSCICGQDTTCHTDQEFYNDTCTCQLVTQISQAETSAVVRDDRDSQEDRQIDISSSDLVNYLHQHWVEMVIIIVLATISVILSIICVVLLKHVNNLKKIVSDDKSAHETKSFETDVCSSCPTSVEDDRDIKQKSSHLGVKNSGQSSFCNIFHKLLAFYLSDCFPGYGDRASMISYQPSKGHQAHDQYLSNGKLPVDCSYCPNVRYTLFMSIIFNFKHIFTKIGNTWHIELSLSRSGTIEHLTTLISFNPIILSLL